MMRPRGKLALLLPGVALAALLAGPLPAEAHKVIVFDDVYDTPGPPPPEHKSTIFRVPAASIASLKRGTMTR